MNTEPVLQIVTETHPYTADILPVNGLYIRNGPNLIRARHIFDGDGMVHFVHFSPSVGEVVYGNDYIHTFRFHMESLARTTLFNQLGNLRLCNAIDLFFKRLVFRIDPFLQNGEGTANTSVVFHAGRLLALNESDFPYELKYDNVSNRMLTIGRYDFNGKLTHNVNAHPKIDPRSKDMYLLGYNVIRKPYCTLSRVDAFGVLAETHPIRLPHPSLLHDFGLTENYVVIFDLPLTFSLFRFCTFRHPIHYNENRKGRIGLFHRSTHNIRWIEFSERLVIFHFVNMWEEDNLLHVYAIAYLGRTFALSALETQRPTLYHIQILLDTNEVHQCVQVSLTPCELPSIHPSHVGRPHAHFYALRIGQQGFDGILRFGTSSTSQEETCIEMPQEMTCSEVCVLEQNRLLLYIYNEKTKCSEIHVYDGNTMNPTPLYVQPLSYRIPFGFHGTFVPTEDLP